MVLPASQFRWRNMGHSELLNQKFQKAGGQGAAAPWRGLGVPIGVN